MTGRLPGEDYRIEIVSDASALLALRHEWDELYNRAERPRLSLSFAWVWCAWETIAQAERARLYCVLLRSEGRLVFAWPLMISRRHRFWTAVRQLASPVDYADVLAEAAPESAARATLAWETLRRSCGTDLILLTQVAPGSLLFDVMAATSAAPIAVQTVHLVDWAGYADWRAYYGGRSMRVATDRRLRRLHRRGEVRIELDLAGERREEVMDWLFAQKRAWYVKTGQHYSSWLNSAAHERFIRQVPGEVGRQGRTMMSVLTLDDAPIAAAFNSADAFRLVYIHSAYDPAFATFSPGHQLYFALARWAYDRRLTFDFLEGDFEYKRQLGNRKIGTRHYLLANSAWGWVHTSLRAARHRLPAQARGAEAPEAG